MKTILKEYLETFDYNDDNQKWFDKISAIAERNGFATDRKAYKADPDKFRGDVSDVATTVRIAVTGRSNTPDLWSIIQIIGLEEMESRINSVIKGE